MVLILTLCKRLHAIVNVNSGFVTLFLHVWVVVTCMKVQKPKLMTKAARGWGQRLCRVWIGKRYGNKPFVSLFISFDFNGFYFKE